MSWKYVVFKCGEFEYPVIFPSLLIHADVAKAMAEKVNFISGKPVSVVSAGEVHGLEVELCSGHSTTIGIASRKTDTRLINNYAYGSGTISDDGTAEFIDSIVSSGSPAQDAITDAWPDQITKNEDRKIINTMESELKPKRKWNLGPLKKHT